MTEQELYEKIVDSIDRNMRDLMVVSVDYERLKTITPEMSLRLADVNKRIKEVLQYIEDTEKQPTDHECLLPVDFAGSIPATIDLLEKCIVEQDKQTRLNVSSEKKSLLRNLKYLRANIMNDYHKVAIINLSGTEFHYESDPEKTVGMFISYFHDTFPQFPLSLIDTQLPYVIQFYVYPQDLLFKQDNISKLDGFIDLIETKFTNVTNISFRSY